MRLEHDKVYILHARAYGETSLIVDAFSQRHGRVSLYARGAKSKKKDSSRRLLNPFTPLLVSAQGRGTLKTLTQVESAGPGFPLRERALYCGLYLNELLARLLSEQDSLPETFRLYEWALGQLAQHDPELGDAPLEAVLRAMEWELVVRLGHGFSLTRCADTGAAVSAEGCYRYQASLGLVACAPGPQTLPGRHLLHFAEMNLQDPATRLEIKRLMRRLLRPLLGGKPLASRQLFL